MRSDYRLTATHTSESISLPFNAVAMAIDNLTASPIYVRLGAPDTPDATNANIIIAGGASRVLAVSGRDFAVALGNATLVSGSSTPTGGLFGFATVTLLSAGEVTPTFGNASLLSLSTAELSNGFQAISPTAQIYDLGPWGGAIIFFAPDSSSGQAWINLEVSSDNVLYKQSQIYAIWPGVPTVVNVPRIMRYLRLTVFATGIAGEPNPSGFFYVRGSLTEITQYTYNPVATSITKVVNIGALSSVTYDFFTAGMPAITAGLNFAVGSGCQLLIYTAQSSAGPWRLALSEERTVQIGGLNDSIYRSYGQLDLYTRIEVSEILNNPAGFRGTLRMLPDPEPDLTAVMQRIATALGDPGVASLVNQNIYAELDTIRTTLAAMNSRDGTYEPELLTIRSTLNTNQPSLPLIKTDLDGIKSDLDQMNSRDSSYIPYLLDIRTQLVNHQPNIDTQTGSAASSLSTYLGPMWTLENTNLPSLASYLPYLLNIKNDADNLPTYLPELANLRSRWDTSSTTSAVEVNGTVACGAGVWATPGAPFPNTGTARIVFIMLSANLNAAGGGSLLQMGFGPFAGVNRILYVYYAKTSAATMTICEAPPVSVENGLKGGGYIIPAGNTQLWINSSVAATVAYSIFYYP